MGIIVLVNTEMILTFHCGSESFGESVKNTDT